MANGDTAWRIDRKVPIAVICTILGQSGVFIWWGASINERVNNLERASYLASASPTLSERLTRVETRFESFQSDILEIKSDLKSLLHKVVP